SDKIVLKMYRAYEVPRQQYFHLYNLIEELSQNAKLPMPKVYMMENSSPNAFATGRDPKHACVCVTKGLLQLLEENELKGVISHELAHVKNRDTLIMTVTASIAGAIMLLANIARWSAILGGGRGGRRGSGNLIGLIVMSIIAPIAALIVQLAISRSREYGADASGARIAKDSKGLAQALNKLSQTSKYKKLEANPQTAHLFIVNPLKGNTIASLFSTHPPIKERIARLSAMKIQ
ncbi:MAG: M48 family metalloprotease, partial [Candidatus Omnitrophica bacterium]|nr:M48 family metalloprotease [Candidatus Omnitrophota bacterium]